MTGFEPLIGWATGAAVTGLANLVTGIVQEKGGGLLGWGGRTLSESTRQAIFNASQQYVKNYSDRHCLLKVLGMREPVSLESIYTTVRLGNEDLQPFVSIADLEAAYRNSRKQRLRRQNSGEKHKGIDVANTEQFLMVLGAPGGGKSTFLRKIGLEALKGNEGTFKHACIPVFIELKGLTSDEINLEQIIVTEFQTCGFPNAKGFTAKALQQGKLLILLDGLDEVPTDNVNRAVKAIQNFVDRYARNRYISSCRIAAYKTGGFRRFRDVTIAEFDDEQIQQFIQNWFVSGLDRQTKTADRCWEVLQRSENAGAKELAHTPLLLTFLCLVYDRSQNFPNNRSVLYRKALRILLEEWAAEKRLENQQQIYEGLSIELEEILLSDIATYGFAKDQLFFSKRELVGRIRAFLESNLNAPKSLDGEAVLDAVARQQGILVERAEDAYSFSHLTLQEYLTAQYIVDNPKFIKQIVFRYLPDERWREIFLLIAGLMTGNRGADGLLLIIEQKAKTYINTPKLNALLQWADRSTTGSKGNYSSAAKRAVAIYLTLFDLAHIRASTRALAYALGVDTNINLALDLVRAFDLVRALDLDRSLAIIIDLVSQEMNFFNLVDVAGLTVNLNTLRSQAPDVYQPRKVRLAFADRISQLWFDALQLNPELVNLSRDEVESLSKYLYANELMVKCKEAAVRVTPGTWAKIEARMLKSRELKEGGSGTALPPT
ncbi:NACHT domain-containing protein [Egbenema bharatensis]|uniref:NACHT domain-containing protein n=1 Tax=Egbenema bharatensis TaxID=3463334 RepID=UPI003A84D444